MISEFQTRLPRREIEDLHDVIQTEFTSRRKMINLDSSDHGFPERLLRHRGVRLQVDQLRRRRAPHQVLPGRTHLRSRWV